MSLNVPGLTNNSNLSKSCDGLSAVFHPRRLSDHLCWRCSSCKSLVTTKETHFHLIECLRTFLDPMRKSVSRGVIKSESDIDDDLTTHKSKSNTTTLARPQTRVIRRPTPHLKHPVITDNGNQDSIRRGKSKNRIKSFHGRFLGHRPIGKAKSLDPTPTIKIDTCKKESSNKTSSNTRFNSSNQEDGSKLLAKLTITPKNDKSCKKNNNNNDSHKTVSRTVSVIQRNIVPEPEPDPEWLEHLTKLKPCRKCKRTFFPERLLVHEPTCNAEPLKINPIKPW